MPYLSQTFESYQRVRIYRYSVNDLGLKKFVQKYGIYGQIEHYAVKIAFCVQCYSVLYFPTAYYSVYRVNSYTSLNRSDYLYLKVVDLVIYLALQYQIAGIMSLKLCKGGNLFLQLICLSMGSICIKF